MARRDQVAGGGRGGEAAHEPHEPHEGLGVVALGHEEVGPAAELQVQHALLAAAAAAVGALERHVAHRRARERVLDGAVQRHGAAEARVRGLLARLRGRRRLRARRRGGDEDGRARGRRLRRERGVGRREQRRRRGVGGDVGEALLAAALVGLRQHYDDDGVGGHLGDHVPQVGVRRVLGALGGDVPLVGAVGAAQAHGGGVDVVALAVRDAQADAAVGEGVDVPVAVAAHDLVALEAEVAAGGVEGRLAEALALLPFEVAELPAELCWAGQCGSNARGGYAPARLCARNGGRDFAIVPDGRLNEAMSWRLLRVGIGFGGRLLCGSELLLWMCVKRGCRVGGRHETVNVYLRPECRWARYGRVQKKL